MGSPGSSSYHVPALAACGVIVQLGVAALRCEMRSQLAERLRREVLHGARARRRGSHLERVLRRRRRQLVDAKHLLPRLRLARHEIQPDRRHEVHLRHEEQRARRRVELALRHVVGARDVQRQAAGERAQPARALRRDRERVGRAEAVIRHGRVGQRRRRHRRGIARRRARGLDLRDERLAARRRAACAFAALSALHAAALAPTANGSAGGVCGSGEKSDPKPRPPPPTRSAAATGAAARTAEAAAAAATATAAARTKRRGGLRRRRPVRSVTE